jgi:hypothetical protein
MNAINSASTWTIIVVIPTPRLLNAVFTVTDVRFLKRKHVESNAQFSYWL